MEKGESSYPSSDRPSIGFPLGLALLLILIFCFSAVLSCCLKWHKLKTLLRYSSGDDQDGIQINISSFPVEASGVLPNHEDQKRVRGKGGDSRAVVMPGDRVPKFIAIACPCKPPAVVEKLTGKVQKPLDFPLVPLYL